MKNLKKLARIKFYADKVPILLGTQLSQVKNTSLENQR